MSGILSKSDRIKALIDHYTPGNKSEFARRLGITPQGLNTWIARGNFDIELVYSKCEGVSAQWLLTGKGNMLSDRTPVVKRYNETEVELKAINSVPLFDLQHVDDLVSLFTNHPAPIDEIKLPNLPKCDGAVYMRGDTMSPELHSGDIVLYKEVKSLRKKENIFFGQIYLLSFEVNNDEHIVIKYVHESDEEGYITLVSCNKRYPPMPIPFESVKAMAMIKASVHYHTIS